MSSYKNSSWYNSWYHHFLHWMVLYSIQWIVIVYRRKAKCKPKTHTPKRKNAQPQLLPKVSEKFSSKFYIWFEKKRARNSLTDSPRKSMKRMLFVTITYFITTWNNIECKKCFENKSHPDYKKHIWSRNVKQYYSKCKFGCKSPEGVTLFVEIIMWMLRSLFRLSKVNHCEFAILSSLLQWY